MTTLPPWWLVITMPPPCHLVNIVPFSSWRTGDARFPLQRWPSKEEAASEPPVTFLYLVLSLSRILSSSFISYIYSHLSLSCSYSFSIASSSSISFLLSRSLCSPPSPTSDPRPTFVTTATSTISSPLHNATQPRPPSYLLLHLCCCCRLYPLPPSTPRPQAQGNAGSLRIQTTEHEVTTRQIWHFGTTLIRRYIIFYAVLKISSMM